ncbi:MAG: Smr/MutS family protein [Pseudomonadota bacterium]
MFDSEERQTLARALEDEARQALEWPALLAALAGNTRSEPGRARLLALEPAATPEEARSRATRVRQVLELGERGVELPVIAFEDVGPALERIRLGAIASGSELRNLVPVLECAARLRDLVEEHGALHPELAAVLDTERVLGRVLARLTEAVDVDGSVHDAASPELARARARSREVQADLKRRLGELVRRYADVLQGSYSTEREGRFVLPVRADAHYRVEGIVLGSSGSGNTLFVEPREITEIVNRLRLREAEVEREVTRVLAELTALVHEHLDAVRAAFESAVTADVLAALARFAVATRAHPLEVGDEARIEVYGARHPLLALAGGTVVPNDIVLRGGQALVVSGPNAGGKTVTLKLLGLFAWMARAGIPVPAAPESTIGWFERVLADVGDEQSLARSLSTFSAHVQKLARVLEHSGPHVLVLLDEVAAGTDPEEGAVLAAAVLEALAKRGAAIAVTTHYERLKELATHSDLLENASVGFDFAAMEPTFRLTLGTPGASSALAVAARHGLPTAIVTRARELLPTAALDRERALREIATERARIDRESAALAEERARLEAYERALDEREATIERTARARVQEETRRLVSEVRAARAELTAARDRLRAARLEAGELREIGRAVNRVAARVAIGGPLAPAPAPQATVRALAPTDLAPGARVRLRSTGAIATVLEPPKGGEVRLRVGGIRLTQPLTALEPAPAGSRKTTPLPQTRAARSDSGTPRLAEPRRTSDNTLDLRGTRIEAAADRLDAFLDRLLGEGEPVGFVLHGHGTGALRDAVRAHLGASSFVEHVRAAEPDEGGDAFTVFWTR